MQTSQPAYQIVIIDSQTIQIVFPPGTTAPNYQVVIVNPQNVVDNNGNLPASLAAQIAVDVNNLYSSSIS